ncbi:hypothetical protein Fmac_024332 [Flemingia macrophylla]|uniref:Uncharacterized protein n=1 Tax=Flemingia macrophylla TaxID=520843 RepID=A0ABD1LP27_9FABA
MVEDGIYRSSFPQPSNFSFLEALNLRSIVYLCPEPYPQQNWSFLSRKDLIVSTVRDTILKAVKVLIASVSEEYKQFAGAKSTTTDLKFIETFDVLTLRQGLNSIIYQYFASKKPRFKYIDENSQKPQLSFREVAIV